MDDRGRNAIKKSILKFLKRKPDVSIAAISKGLRYQFLPIGILRRILRELEDTNEVHRLGKKRWTVYY